MGAYLKNGTEIPYRTTTRLHPCMFYGVSWGAESESVVHCS